MPSEKICAFVKLDDFLRDRGNKLNIFELPPPITKISKTHFFCGKNGMQKPRDLLVATLFCKGFSGAWKLGQPRRIYVFFPVW